MARDQAEKKTVNVSIRMTAEQKHVFEERAKITGVKPSNNIVNATDVDPTNCMMLITSDSVNYSINSGRVLYYNSNAVYVNENTVLSTGQGKAVIVFTFN